MQFRFASILFISLVLFIIFPCGRVFAENVQDLQLSLSLEKSEYATGEPIIVKEEIKNVGSEPVLVCVDYTVWGNQEYKGPGIMPQQKNGVKQKNGVRTTEVIGNK